MTNSKKSVSNSLSARVLRKCKFSYNRILRDTGYFLRKTLKIEDYRDYIMKTNREWWGGESEGCCEESLSVCIDTLFDRNDPEDKFHCCPYWQRRLTNKLSAREFAVKYGVPVPELYWYGKDTDNIPFNTLPAEYVIKTSFGAASRDVLPIVRGVNVFTNEVYDEEKMRLFFKRKMEQVKPFGYIMVEQFIETGTKSNVPKDYKCHVFAGSVYFVQVVDRAHNLENWYTKEWKEVPQMCGNFQRGKSEDPPMYFSELIQYAEILGKKYGHKYVRIDFYITEEGCVFGEFTATPSGGFGESRYGNRVLGRLWETMENDL